MTMKAPKASPGAVLADRDSAADGLIAIGAELHGRGWSLATSSNYSVRLSEDPFRLLVTASGKHKDRLTRDDFVVLDELGEPVEPGSPKSSAESMLHVVLARQAGAGAVLHTHSPWGTLLSDLNGPEGVLTLSGYEMLKAVPGVTTHDTSVDVAVLPNTQDIAAMAEELADRLAEGDRTLTCAFLIHKHGLYTWADNLDNARAQLEALEFLFECEGRRRGQS